MKINNQEVSVEDLLKDNDLHNDMLINCGNGIYLTKAEQEVLNRYEFDYKKYNSIKSLIFDIEEYLNDNYDQDIEDLESVETSLQEFNYYHDTNK